MNKDVNKRDMILFGEEYDEEKYSGGIREFHDVTLKKLMKLVEEDFIELGGTQNFSPTTEEFMEFMEEYSGFTVFGYAVSPTRADYRVTIEGIESRKRRGSVLEAFADHFRFADEFNYNPPYAWWD